MFRSSLLVLLAAVCVTASTFAQGTATPASPSQATAGGPIAPPKPPLFFQVEWNGKKVTRGCANIHDQLCEPAVTQEFVSNPNVELQLYGAGKQRVLENGEIVGAILVSGNHLWTGVIEQPAALALRDKNNYVDLSGRARIRWPTRASGLHRVHPIVKLADGTWLLGEHADGANQIEVHPSEFIVSEQRWIKLDINRVVTLGPRDPDYRKVEREYHGDWLDSSRVDLTKVDAVGFADLMPGSGHGYGGFISVGTIEVYGKPVPR